MTNVNVESMKILGKTIISQTNIIADGYVTIYTVTAGKTFYLVSAYCNASTSGSGFIAQLIAGAQILIYLGPLVAVGATVTCGLPLSLAAPIPFPAGTIFRIYSNDAAMVVTGGIIGWEE